MRRSELRSATVVTLLRAQHFLTRQQWSDAEPILTGIEAEIRKEIGFVDLGKRVGEMLTLCRKGRAVEDARGQDQERLHTFRVHRKEALYHEAHFTGLGVSADQEAVRRSTRAAWRCSPDRARKVPGRWDRFRRAWSNASKKRSRKAATSFS